jgi:CDP-4-dehydro-6-deoxyglucose reductase, E3
VPTVQFISGGKVCSVSAQGKTSLLDHALAAGVAVSYSCRRGDCGQCVATLLAGELEPIDAARPLVGDGGIFLCNALARNDVVVELPHLPELEGIRVLRSPCKIHELGRMSQDVLQVTLRLPPSVRFEYRAGQYIRLAKPDRLTRSYSLSEPPTTDKLLRIHVRRIDGGAFSRYLFESAKVGDLLHLEGPLGRFILRDGISVRKTVFLATGTGIAPIHALLASLGQRQTPGCGELFLYWGNRLQADAYFQAPLEELARSAGVSYFELYSRPPGSEPGPTARHVQDLMASHHPDLTEAQVFASGNPAMIEGARARSALLGLPGERFFCDPFTAS